MPESRDYYRGRTEALEEFHRNVGLPPIAQNAIWDRIVSARDSMATLPPAKPAPELPNGKPLVYEDPSPCPDCAAGWGLVEECAGLVSEILNDMPEKIDPRMKYREYQFDDLELERAQAFLDRVSAARQKRGA